MTSSRPAAQDDINIENLGVLSKLVQVLTMYWRPVRCFFFAPRRIAFFCYVWIEITIPYSSAVPIFCIVSAIEIGTVFEPI